MTTQTQAQPTVLKVGFKLDLWHISMILIVIGVFITTYLSYVVTTATPMQCIVGSVFNCDVVQNSSYAKMWGIPIAVLGWLVYMGLWVMLIAEKRIKFFQTYGVMLQFGVILFAFLYSMWLVYLQFFRLQALCMWCLMHELNMTVLFVVACFRLRNALNA
jgi:uncharacterized membrane protein